MATKSANLYARVEPEVKEQAESILNQLGIPFEMKLSSKKPLVMGKLTEGQLDAEIAKGMAGVENGRVYSVEEVDEELHRLYGI